MIDLHLIKLSNLAGRKDTEKKWKKVTKGLEKVGTSSCYYWVINELQLVHNAVIPVNSCVDGEEKNCVLSKAANANTIQNSKDTN